MTESTRTTILLSCACSASVSFAVAMCATMLALPTPKLQPHDHVAEHRAEFGDPYTDETTHEQQNQFNKLARQLGAGIPNKDPQAVWGSAFELIARTSAGKARVRAALWEPISGSTTFDMHDDNDVLRFRIQLRSDGPEMTFNDRDGGISLGLWSDRAGSEPHLRFRDDKGRVRLALGVSRAAPGKPKQPFITMYDHNGNIFWQARPFMSRP